MIKSTVQKILPLKVRAFISELKQALLDPKNYMFYFRRYKSVYNLWKSPIVQPKPLILGVLVNDQCNLRCPSCYFILQNDGDDKKFFNSIIDPEKLYHVVKEFNKDKQIDHIGLNGGEILMHPDIAGLVSACKNAGVHKILANSNGILVKKHIEDLKLFTAINISMDGHDYESFYKFRAGTRKQYEDIIEGLHEMSINNINYSVSFVLSQDNIHTIHDILNFCTSIAPNSVNFYNLNPHGSDEYLPLKINDGVSVKILNEVMQRDDYNFNVQLPVVFNTEHSLFRESKCPQPWNRLYFNSKGDVSPCCQIEQSSQAGNVFEGYDMNSEYMQRFRENFINNKFPEDSCLYCGRRFTGLEYGFFNHLEKKWVKTASWHE